MNQRGSLGTVNKTKPSFHNRSQIWGDCKFSFKDIVSIIICWFSFVAKWTIFWSWLSLLKWKSWWIMAHFPCYALSSSLEMMHGLKLTHQKTKSNIGGFSFLSLMFTYEMKSCCSTCCTRWPSLTGILNPVTAAAVYFNQNLNPGCKTLRAEVISKLLCLIVTISF